MVELNQRSYALNVLAYRASKVNPWNAPLWKQTPTRGLPCLCRPAIFFFDENRARWLLHARTQLNQAYPTNERGPDYRRLPSVPPLVPSRCTGKWFLVSNTVAEGLQSVEADMHSVWEAIESGRQITKEEEASSLYLRQVFDHFLWCLAKSARPNEATFDNPLPLTSIEEPHMRNAVLNKSEGRSYSEGAWILLDRVKNDQRVSRKLRHRASSGGAGTSDTKRKYGSEEGPNANDADSKPRYYKKIKREKGSGPEQQQTITGEMNDSTAEHHQPADQEEQPLEDDLTDTDSTLSNISSSSSEEEPLRDSRTPGSSRPLAARPVDEQPSSSKKVQFVTMFDQAVPILQAILDEMPISPEDLEGHPNSAERQADLVQWGHRKGQAVRLLGAMQKAYVSVMVPAEPENDKDPQTIQRIHSAQHGQGREQTLANDLAPQLAAQTDDAPHAAQALAKESTEDTRSSNQMAQGNTLKSGNVGRSVGRGKSAKPTPIGPEKGKGKAKPAMAVSSRDDGFWAAFGY